jgi:4-oxalocrotonate tautomerase
MPHVIVKLWPGKSEAQRRDLAAAIVRETGRILDYGNDAVSVGFEEVRPEDWTARVYEPDIPGQVEHVDEAARLRPRREAAE